jgi:hypothetical protein
VEHIRLHFSVRSKQADVNCWPNSVNCMNLTANVLPCLTSSELGSSFWRQGALRYGHTHTLADISVLILTILLTSKEFQFKVFTKDLIPYAKNANTWIMKLIASDAIFNWTVIPEVSLTRLTRRAAGFQKQVKPQGSVCIPYVKGVSEKFERIWNQYNIRTLVRRKHTLRSSLMITRPERGLQ